MHLHCYHNYIDMFLSTTLNTELLNNDSSNKQHPNKCVDSRSVYEFMFCE